VNPDRIVLQAPERLVSEHRLDFRRDALERLSRAATDGARRITIDLRETREVDASGLGVLVLLQKRAREHFLGTCLTNTPPSVRQLLRLTQLENLFEFED
jgi:anti-anti-sigma factor